MSLGQAAVSTAVAESVSNSVKGSSTAPGSSQADSQPGSSIPPDTMGDDFEQDSKPDLKAEQHSEMLGKTRDQRLKDEQAKRAQREAFADATLKVFTAKLAGNDMAKAESHAGEDISVEKHVDQLIKQATSLTTLCQMYEGWTAWI